MCSQFFFVFYIFKFINNVRIETALYTVKYFLTGCFKLVIINAKLGPFLWFWLDRRRRCNLCLTHHLLHRGHRTWVSTNIHTFNYSMLYRDTEIIQWHNVYGRKYGQGLNIFDECFWKIRLVIQILARN